MTSSPWPPQRPDAYPSSSEPISEPSQNHSTCGQPWADHPWPATHCPPARRVCVSRHHRAVIYTYNGTDRCDACQDENRAEMDAQR